MQLQVLNHQQALAVSEGWVHDLASRTIGLMNRQIGELSIVLVDNATIRDINARYLGHDWSTDVISFDLAEADQAAIHGELIVSAEMASNQATNRHGQPLDELAMYLVHGLLHLCGYDDHADEDVMRMRRLENEVLTSLGVPNPFPHQEQIFSGSPPAGQEMPSWPR